MFVNKLLGVLMLFSLLSCDEKRNNNIDQFNGDSKYVFNYDDIIEEYCRIGELSVLTREYQVYNCFKKIKTANDYHGQSFIIFISEMDTLVYVLDFIDDLPDSVMKNKIYKRGIGIDVNEISNPLCLHNGCYELAITYKNILIGLDSLN